VSPCLLHADVQVLVQEGPDVARVGRGRGGAHPIANEAPGVNKVLHVILPVQDLVPGPAPAPAPAPTLAPVLDPAPATILVAAPSPFPFPFPFPAPTPVPAPAPAPVLAPAPVPAGSAAAALALLPPQYELELAHHLARAKV